MTPSEFARAEVAAMMEKAAAENVDQPAALQGLVGNPDAWDLNTNSIISDAALIYYEVFETGIDAYVIELDDEPSDLPAPATISLRHPLTPAVLGELHEVSHGATLRANLALVRSNAALAGKLAALISEAP